jgi:uncharacterized membrane-anchored protein
MTHDCQLAGPAVPARHARRSADAAGPVKVPEKITGHFWVIKILSTGMGEAFADYLALRYSPILAGVVGTVLFVLGMYWQLTARRYSAVRYWFAVAMVAVFGTLGADGLHIVFGVPYTESTAGFLVVLAVIILAWYRTEGTLSIHSVVTPRRELFYWATVVATFALGTAVGDLTATTFGLGYFASGVLFLGLFLVPGLAYRGLGLNSVAAFWAAYILTRPLGASFADWMGVAHRYGGLGWGRGAVALILALPIVALVAYVARARPDVVRRGDAQRPAAGARAG